MRILLNPKSIIIPLSAFFLGSNAVPTTAAPAWTKEDPATQVVTFSNRDLRSIAGRARLEWRIRSAASRLCLEDYNASPVAYVNSGCYRAAMANALKQVDRAIARANDGRVIAASALVISGK